MDIGNGLRELRVGKRLSHGDIAGRSGLLRHYVSRVENGHATPSLPVLERSAAALELEVYQIFFTGLGRPEAPELPETIPTEFKSEHFWDSSAGCRSKTERC